MAQTEKLQKVLARAGLGSRREMEVVIEAGRVSVDGEVATLGDRVDTQATIRVDGRLIRIKEEKNNKSVEFWFTTNQKVRFVPVMTLRGVRQSLIAYQKLKMVVGFQSVAWISILLVCCYLQTMVNLQIV